MKSFGGIIFTAVGVVVAVLFAMLASRLTRKRAIQNSASAHFLGLIKSGYRVYDAYIAWPIDNGARSEMVKFSILSKRPIDKLYIDTHVSEHCSGVVKNRRAKDCPHITFNGKDIYSYDSLTGKTRKPVSLYFE